MKLYLISFSPYDGCIRNMVLPIDANSSCPVADIYAYLHTHVGDNCALINFWPYE